MAQASDTASHHEQVGEASANEDLSELMHRVHLLRHVSLFQGMTSRDLSVIARRLHKMSVQKRGLSSFRKGIWRFPDDYGRRRAGVYRSGQPLGELKRGDCFGEMAILTQGARTATIRAEENVLLWRLDSSVFYDMMFDQTSIAVEMMKLLSRRLRSELERGSAADKSELVQPLHAEVSSEPAIA